MRDSGLVQTGSMLQRERESERARERERKRERDTHGDKREIQ